MDRRGFFRILSATSASALAGGCGKHTDQLIPLLVPEHEILSGIEQWHPAVCSECGAGCGTLVRVMEAVRTVERHGEKVRERIAAVKKVEGNPLDPVSGGRLCARGQAAVQALYHPDRLRGPMKRAGDRGKARFTPISWDDALAMAAEAIAKARAADPGSVVALTAPAAGSRSLALERFLQALGAPAPVVCSLAGFAVEQTAARKVFGWKGLPVYDLANAHTALGVGADFLGGWASPVYYNRQYGQFRQGRREVRGTLFQAESRLSITAAAADRWLPLRPGREPQFLAALGRMLLDLGVARNGHLPPGVLQAFQSADTAALLAACGLPEERVRDVARALGESQAPLVIGGASIVQSNSLDAVTASHYVNLMLGNIGRKGGVMPPASPAPHGFAGDRPDEALKGARVVLLDEVNPVYTMPPASGVLDALSRADMVIGISGFLDDSGAWADLLLPTHHAFESEVALLPAVAPRPSVTIGTAFIEPLYDTRAPGKLWSDLAGKMKLEYQPVTAQTVAAPFLADGASFEDAARQGGAWGETAGISEAGVAAGQALDVSSAIFDGESAEFPMHFQPYLSLQFHEGRGSHLPWLQELPDPVSSSIWGLPVEIDAVTARRSRISNGDIVRVRSRHGSIEAPAYVHPGAIPGVVSMAIGDGHTHYGRYATGRGSNPLSILAPVHEESTGALAFGATRVSLARVGGPRNWIQFSAPDREDRGSGHR